MRVLFYIFTLLLLFSCSKKELGPQCISCAEEGTNTSNTDVLIINEGSFGWGNGSIFLYKTINKTISQNIFQQANNGIPLGDVVQSITQIGNKAYIVVNNSGKIEVVDITNFSSITTITGFTSPRYFLPVSSSKAYVTDLYSNSIQILDLLTHTISGTINTSGWTEELLIHNDTVYVCDMTNNNLLIINPNTDAIIDSVKVGIQPNSIVKDKNNKLWILCDGGFNVANPKLIKFNPLTRAIEATFVFSNIADSPSKLAINGSGTQLYYINNNIYSMNISSTNLPTSTLVSNNSNTFYGLEIDPITNDIYVADAIDFIQNGVVYRYDALGVLLHQFQSGIIPNGFLFIR